MEELIHLVVENGLKFQTLEWKKFNIYSFLLTINNFL